MEFTPQPGKTLLRIRGSELSVEASAPRLSGREQKAENVTVSILPGAQRAENIPLVSAWWSLLHPAVRGGDSQVLGIPAPTPPRRLLPVPGHLGDGYCWLPARDRTRGSIQERSRSS